MEEETLFERLAHERDITVEEMRAIISAHIEAGMNALPWKSGCHGNGYLSWEDTHARGVAPVCGGAD